jgi:hypothetical protein
MTTLLEVAIAKLLGPPLRDRGDGQSEWPCPGCGREKFHTMPDRPEYKHRFRCWACAFRGDLDDFLKHVGNVANYTDRLRMAEDLQAEFEALQRQKATRPATAAAPTTAATAPVDSPPGSGGSDVALFLALSRMTGSDFITLEWLDRLARAAGVSLERLAREARAWCDAEGLKDPEVLREEATRKALLRRKMAEARLERMRTANTAKPAPRRAPIPLGGRRHGTPALNGRAHQ